MLHLSCLSAASYSKQRCMIQDRKLMSDDRKLPDTDTFYRRREWSGSFCLFGFLVFAALACGGCQSPLPPLPYPPGPYTAVRLSPGDVVKLSFAEETDLDQVQKIRRDGKISLPLIGEVQAAGKRVMDFQNQPISRYDEHLDNPEVLVTLETSPATVIISGFASNP